MSRSRASQVGERAPAASHGSSEHAPLGASLTALVGWLAVTALTLWAVGLYPTWRLAGRPGLVAQALAGGVVALVMLANAVAVKFYAGLGPARAAFAFMFSAGVRIVICSGATALAWALTALPVRALLFWTGLFYLALMTVEGLWMARALGRDAFLVDLGELRCPKRLLPSDLEKTGEDNGDAGQRKPD